MNERLQKLESIRGFAAAYVFAGHFLLERAVEKSSVLGFTLRFGQEAVILFFIISGFVIYLSSAKDREQTFRLYFMRRVRRIYPIYLIALLVSWILSSEIDAPNNKDRLIQLLGNIFMLQDFSSGKPGIWFSPVGGNVVLWSLSYEWWFYMMFFPVNKYLPARQQLHAVGALSLIGFFTYQIMPNQVSLFLMYFLLWWTGVELARTYMSNRPISYRSERKTLAYLTALAILMSIPCVIAVISREPLGLGIHPILEFRHFAACLVFIGVGIAWRNIEWKFFSVVLGPFSLIAPISYALYVFHYPLAVSGSYLANIESKWQQDVLYIAIAVFLAYLAEVPLQRQINRRFPVSKKLGQTPGCNCH